jgi:hypothetical protein
MYITTRDRDIPPVEDTTVVIKTWFILNLRVYPLIQSDLTHGVSLLFFSRRTPQQQQLSIISPLGGGRIDEVYRVLPLFPEDSNTEQSTHK